MSWAIDWSRQASAFLEKNRIAEEQIFNLIRDTLKKFSGEDVNIDVSKLKGKWEGFHRIRKGKLRVIVAFDFDHTSAFIEVVDWRGSAYQH